MKKNLIAKTAALLLAASLTFALASCGSSDSSSSGKSEDNSPSASGSPASADSPAETSSPENADIKGETKTWGIYTVLVPEGWTLRTGDVFDDNDESVCSVKKSDFSYFELKCETEDTQKKKYEYNKKTYTLEQKDLPASTIAGIEWNGFEYGNELSKGFELYGTSNGRFLRISSVGFSFDSAEAKAILESFKVTAAEEESKPDESAPDESQPGEQPAVPATAALAEKAKMIFNGVTVSVGDKYADVKDALGEEAAESKKSQPCVPGAQEVEYHYYAGFIVEVNYEGTIMYISLSEENVPGTEGSTAGGLKLKDTREKAKQFLGEPDEEDEFHISYKDGSLTMNVYIREKDGIFIISAEDTSIPF